MSARISSTLDLWVTRPVPLPSARLRLFCLPHAGSGVAQFRPWARLLPADVELCPIRLPGRETRLAEPLFTRIRPAVDAIATAIEPYLDRPYAFFGHSMGALLTYELTRRLSQRKLLLPAHLFVSARRAPHLPDRDTPMHALPDREFIAELVRRYGEGSATLLRDPELGAVFLPILRADFELVEAYQHVAASPLGIPITALGGMADGRVDEAELAAWGEHTSARFRIRRFAGDHFYMQAAQPQLLTEIALGLNA